MTLPIGIELLKDFLQAIMAKEGKGLMVLVDFCTVISLQLYRRILLKVLWGIDGIER